MRFAIRVVFLTALWVLMWGRLSVANVASGLVVSSLLLVLFPPFTTSRPGRMSHPHPLALIRLFAFIVGQMVVSNAYIAREIITPGSRIRTGIVACRLHTNSDRLIAFVTNVVALSPGVMPVHVEADPAVIYVHVLHLYEPAKTRSYITKLETLAIKAFGTPT